MGGPFVPVPSDADPDTFRDGVELAKAQIDRFETLREKANGLPLMAPMSRGSITSRFGVRTDPFRRRPAMHTGIDFRAPSGEAAKATAPGKVISAGYEGGYGYMVEYPIARAFVDARVHRIYAGTTEIMKELVARTL